MGTIEKISCAIATLGPVGYLPAPGTCGTICAVPIMYALRTMLAPSLVLMIMAAVTLVAFFAVHLALPSFTGQHDPSQIVIDEFVGFCMLACIVPLNPILFLAGFLLFRFFDIVKPLGIKSVERLYGVIGIMLDDIAAAFYAGLGVWGAIFLLRYMGN